MNILCIDDDPVILTQYEHVLAKHMIPGDYVHKASTGEAGIALAMAMPVDVVFCDLVLPDISGLDVIRRIKEQRPRTEVVVLTGFGSIDTAVEAIKIGARDYLTKPVNSTVLIEKLETLREVIDLAGEAEDYRYAKEVVEESARRSISELEMKLNGIQECLRVIQGIAAAPGSDSDKLTRIVAAVAKAGV